jgi:hypothetical protein
VPSDLPPDGGPFTPIRYTSDVFPTERADTDYSPTGRRHRKHGSARRRTPRYQPGPRRRVKAAWWMILLIIALVLVLILVP